MRMKMRAARCLVVVFALLALIVAPGVAEAFCGFYVGGAGAKMFNDATVVVMMREGTRTVLSMQNAYKGPPEKFAMVVPVPVVLQEENVKTLAPRLFDHIDQLAAPRLVEYWEQDPCSQELKTPSMQKSMVPAPMAAAVAEAAPAKDLGVKIEAQFAVGEYQIVILSAQDSSGLDEWLHREGYNIPAGGEPYFRPYVASGSKFFVARVDITKVKMENGQAVLSPLRFHYDSDEFRLPVRLGLINSSGTQDLIVHILGMGTRYEVANYPNVTIPTNLDVTEAASTNFGQFYTALFDRTLEKNPKAVVTEYAWEPTSCDPCPGPALDFSELATFGSDVLPSNQKEPIPSPTVIPPPPPTAASNCAPPFTVDANGRKHYKVECLTGPIPPASTASAKTPPPPPPPSMPRFQANIYRPMVLTRLHVRYTKESLGEDLVFREAKPITGGREVKGPDGKTLEHGAVQASMNNFQARYAVRHAWTGPIECKEPIRGVWGAKPGKDESSMNQLPTKPQAASKLGFVTRTKTDVASYLKQDVPEIGVVATTSAKKKGCSGCAIIPQDDDTKAGLLVSAVAVTALATRRSRRKIQSSRS